MRITMISMWCIISAVSIHAKPVVVVEVKVNPVLGLNIKQPTRTILTTFESVLDDLSQFFDWKVVERTNSPPGPNSLQLELDEYDRIILVEHSGEPRSRCGGIVVSSATYQDLVAKKSVAAFDADLRESLDPVARCIAGKAVERTVLVEKTEGLPNELYVRADLGWPFDRSLNAYAFDLEMRKTGAADQERELIHLTGDGSGKGDTEIYLNPSESRYESTLRLRVKKSDRLRLNPNMVNPNRVGRFRDRRTR